MPNTRRSLGPIEYAILGLICLAPRHGYELAAQLQPESELGDALRVDLSDLYAALKRLEQRGLVTSHVEAVGTRPPRRIHHLTELGEAEFRRWILEPVRHNREIRIDFILKLYFVNRLAPEHASDLLGRQLAAALDQLARLQREVGGHPPGSFAWILRQMRLSAIQGTIAWLEELQAVWRGQRSA
jgi:PadR family transcriptional regulator, regulatory protein AphA